MAKSVKAKDSQKQKFDKLLKKHGKDKDAQYKDLENPEEMEAAVFALHKVTAKQVERAGKV